MNKKELNQINNYISSIINPFIATLGIDFGTKEQGHKFYQIAEEYIRDKLVEQFNAKIPKKARDIADVVVFGTPVNIKFGISENFGRPNLVSMNRLINLSSESELSQYIILKIKVFSPEKISVSTVDILSNLNLVSYNAGPGQTMLKEKQYYQHLEANKFNFGVSKKERNTQLEYMYLDGLENLQINRDKVKKENLKLLRK